MLQADCTGTISRNILILYCVYVEKAFIFLGNYFFGRGILRLTGFGLLV
jgi:hypothetical protein